MIRLILILFSVGAVIGPIGDFCHVITQTISYPTGYAFYFFNTIPFWVPLLFGSATVCIGVSHPLCDRLLSVRVRPGLRGAWPYVAPVFFLVSYSVSGLLPMADIILAIAAISTWYGLDRTGEGLLLAVLTAMGGTLVEIFLVSQEIFSYLFEHAHFYGVPTWLPWLYAIASVTVGNLGRVLYEAVDINHHTHAK